MSLMHPHFLLALFALLIPIIIHLFNFRRFKRLEFPNVRFLKEVELQTRSRNRLKHWLVLLSRLLAVGCLVLAFCRPFIPLGNQDSLTGERYVAVYLDNSYSMELENEGGSLFRQAKEQARNLVASLGRTDRFVLLTNDLLPEHQRIISSTEIQDYIDEVQPSPDQRSLSEIYERVEDTFDKAQVENRTLYVFSDMQKSTFDLEPSEVDSSLNLSLLRMESEGQGNVFIDTLYFYSPVRSAQSPEQLKVRVVNSSAKDVKGLPIRLSINGVQKSLGTMDIAPYSSTDSILTYRNEGTGWMKGKVEIEDFPIVFDDELFFSYEISEQRNLLAIGPSEVTALCLKVFQNDPDYKTESVEARSLDFSSLTSQDLIFLCQVETPSSGLSQALENFVAEGGSLVIIPPSQLDLASYKGLLTSVGANPFTARSETPRKADRLDLQHPFFRDVFEQTAVNMDLPKTSAHYSTLARVQSREEALIRLQDGNSLLSVFPFQNGRTYVFSASLDPEMSDLASHSIFVTSILRMAETSIQNSDLYAVIGEDKAINVPYRLQNDEPLKMRSEDGTLEFIPEQQSLGSITRLQARGQVTDAGHYKVLAGEVVIQEQAYNLDRKESEMDFMGEEEIQALIAGYGHILLNTLDAQTDGSLKAADLTAKELWRWFLIAALLFLAVEVLLLKFLPS